jgi:hypothetical protein
MFLWRRDKDDDTKPFYYEPTAIDPLASKENAETFGIAYGVGQAIGIDPVVAGAAALYAKAEQEARDNAKPHSRGRQAGSRPKGAHRN